MKIEKKIKIFFILGFFVLIFFSLLVYTLKKPSTNNKPLRVFELNHQVNKFNLLTHNGKKFNSEFFSKYPSIFFFGFLNCPDVCPATLTKISQIIEKLEENKSRVKFYFVTVDPDRDNLENMRDYLKIFDSQIIGITGEYIDIKNFLNYMHVYSEKVFISENDYTIDHSSQIFLFKKNGSFFGTISLSDEEQIIFKKINKLIFGA